MKPVESDWMAEKIRVGRVKRISNQMIAAAIREEIVKIKPVKSAVSYLYNEALEVYDKALGIDREEK